MDVVLVPGLWLDGTSWDQVVPGLADAGLRPRAVTLPGMAAPQEDRSAVRLADLVAAVVGAIDAPDGPVAVVGHSAGAAIAWAAVDARVERVAQVVLVGGFPVGPGLPPAPDFEVVGSEVPLPPWSQFDEADLQDMGPERLAVFRQRAIPAPACVVSDPQQLSDERRLDVPVTVVCTEFPSAALREWTAQGLPPVQELARIRSVRLVDLPTGHWPQLTRPVELAGVIRAAVGS